MARRVTIESRMTPLPNQNHRSSQNFTTKDMAKRVIIRAYYDYGQPNQKEAGDLVFDIKVDKSGLDTTWQKQISSGRETKNTGNRNLYIANPKRTGGSDHSFNVFTVEVTAN